MMHIPNHMLWELTLVLLLFSCGRGEETPWFRSHTVSRDLPGEPYRRFGSPAVADFDNECDLDFSLSVTKGDLILFEKKGKKEWI